MFVTQTIAIIFLLPGTLEEASVGLKQKGIAIMSRMSFWKNYSEPKISTVDIVRPQVSELFSEFTTEQIPEIRA